MQLRQKKTYVTPRFYPGSEIIIIIIIIIIIK